jgi:ribokinase
MDRLTLLSLGSINADFQVRVDEPLGHRKTLAQGLCRLSGGKASNTAYLAARFGHRSILLSRRGDDAMANQALGRCARPAFGSTGSGMPKLDPSACR